MNLTSLLALIVSSTLVYSAPLILTSLGGVYSENSGIVNIGLEGIMTVGAFTSIIFNPYKSGFVVTSAITSP